MGVAASRYIAPRLKRVGHTSVPTGVRSTILNECLRTRVLFREEIFKGGGGVGCRNVATFRFTRENKERVELFSLFAFSYRQ